MKLHILGVNGPYPAGGGATSGYLLEAGEQLLQFDFGSGILSRLTALTAPEQLSAIFLSHWHFDHTADLLPLIYRLEAAKAVLPLYAPVDEASPVQKMLSVCPCFTLCPVAPGDEIHLGEVKVQVGPARHPVPAVGYRVDCGDVSFGYTGDTNTLEGLDRFYARCKLLLADGLFPSNTWNEQKPHLSAPLAARLAQEAGAERLLLTHFNPAIPEDMLLDEARQVFRQVSLACSGEVIRL